MLGFITRYCCERFIRRVTLADDVAAVEDRDERGVIDAAMEFGDKLARLADEIGFDFEAER